MKERTKETFSKILSVTGRKLKSKDGVSIIIALLFFLVCVTVGVITLVSASSSSGVLSTLGENEQGYLTVSSAAQMLRDELAGSTYSYTKAEASGGGSSSGHFNMFNTQLESLAKTNLIDRGASSPLDIQVNVDGIDKMQTVYGILQMNSAGVITINLYLKPDGTTKTQPIRVTMKCRDADGNIVTTPEITEGAGDTQDIDTSTMTTLTYTWPKELSSITRGGTK